MNVLEAYRWLETELRRYTYKPGFTMKLASPDAVRLDTDIWAAPPSVVSFEMLVPDSRRTVPTGRIVIKADGPAWMYQDVATEAEVAYPVVPVGKRAAVPYDAIGDTFAFERWLMHQLDDMERHETREWLRRDGELVDDPHARPTIPVLADDEAGWKVNQ